MLGPACSRGPTKVGPYTYRLSLGSTGPMVYLLFFLSGLSGLIYQIVWVRVFGNVFGNTIHSASIVVAVFMVGLGAGSYLAGGWADRRYVQEMSGGSARPNLLLRAYGQVELAIAAIGLGIALVLPHLGALSASVSSYVREPSGWYALSTWRPTWRVRELRLPCWRRSRCSWAGR